MTANVTEIRHEKAKRVCKRAFDVLVIIFLLPITIFISAVILLTILVEQLFTGDYGPFFLSEPRISRGRPFGLIKLNMFKEAPRRRYMEENEYFKNYGSHAHLQRDPASLRFIGPIMKKFYLDELGQFINIIKGEMSNVGPRPQPPIQTNNSLPPRKLLNTGIFCFKANRWKNRGKTILQQQSDMDYYECYAISSVPGLIRLDLLILLDGTRAIIRGEGL